MFEQAYGMSLVVAFSHASLAPGRVIINDGATEVGEIGAETESTTFDALPGPGTLWIYTLQMAREIEQDLVY